MEGLTATISSLISSSMPVSCSVFVSTRSPLMMGSSSTSVIAITATPAATPAVESTKELFSSSLPTAGADATSSAAIVGSSSMIHSPSVSLVSGRWVSSAPFSVSSTAERVLSFSSLTSSRSAGSNTGTTTWLNGSTTAAGSSFFSASFEASSDAATATVSSLAIASGAMVSSISGVPICTSVFCVAAKSAVVSAPDKRLSVSTVTAATTTTLSGALSLSSNSEGSAMLLLSCLVTTSMVSWTDDGASSTSSSSVVSSWMGSSSMNATGGLSGSSSKLAATSTTGSTCASSLVPASMTRTSSTASNGSTTCSSS
mmetsp:Transcript_34351/g.71523  ORF Transcript_34351/g.71523 Transcript_34351/m.71523 type:complete len:314 (+) Transcript_34351:479-1420(+)